MHLITRRLWWLIRLFILMNTITINGQANSDEDHFSSDISDNDSYVQDLSLRSISDLRQYALSAAITNDNTSNASSSTTSIATATTPEATTLAATTLTASTSAATTPEATTSAATTSITTTDSTVTIAATATIIATDESTTSTTTTTTTTTPTTTPSTTTSTATTSTSTSTSTTSTSTTTTSTTTTTTTTTSPPKCMTDKSEPINVINRTSTMFTALITYSCSHMNEPGIVTYNTTASNCSVTILPSGTENHTIVDVTCNNLLNYAGRDWFFELIGNDSSKIVENKTFEVTLEPLPLNGTNFNIISNDSFTATVIVPGCEKISDIKYLAFSCNGSNTSNNALSSDCTCTCSNLEPGSIYNMSLLLLPIPKKDKTINNETFPPDSSSKTHKTDLDTAKKLTFENNSTKNGTAFIHFQRPQGNYDKIRIDCTAQDQICSTQDHNLTNTVDNCINCTSAPLHKVVLGVSYTCEALTMKESFPDVISDKLNFNTDLRTVQYDGPTDFNTSHLIFHVIPHSDFDKIELTCIVAGDKLPPCSNLTLQNNTCSTTLAVNGTLGCDYNCFFTTKKADYTDEPSPNIPLTIYPPKPTITTESASRWISATWKINEISYIKSFDIFRDSTHIGNMNRSSFSSNATNFSYNYTNLTPYHSYTLKVQLNSNHNTSSESVTVSTAEEAPEKPTDDDVMNKVVPQNDNSKLPATQYTIDIDLSLFSDEFGFVKDYIIYVRQDMTQNDTVIKFNGTYEQAKNNQSIDYLALILQRSSLEKKNTDSSNSNFTSVILGNGPCSDPSVVPCNDKLKPSTNYRIVLAGCTTGGCTNVISIGFITPSFSEPNKLLWLLILPGVTLLIIVAFAIRWKRRSIKRVITQQFRGRTRSSSSSRSSSIQQSSYQIIRKKPKLLYQYVNLTIEDERTLHNEYQELENDSPQYRQSDYEPEYAVYNRYANIPARGPWNNTAVRLIGDHRLHDYINANEIKGLYSDKQYIACQGPLEDTTEDFWEMIIQYNVPKIVMLTRIEESNPHNPSQLLSKCFGYFPENKGQTLKFNNVTVQVIQIENLINANLEIRHLLIKNGQEQHRVFHYYFTGWPDFSVVDPEKLLDLIETVDDHGQTFNSKRRDDLLKPTVIHCSAGVGRTGTYIAVDIIRRLINQSQRNLSKMELDVMGIVYQLRQDRAKMVQTKEQYILVNRCVEECLRRIDRLNEVTQQASAYDYAQTPSAPTDEYVNCTVPDKDRGFEGSCSYSKKRKDSASTDNIRNHGTDVVYRTSK